MNNLERILTRFEKIGFKMANFTYKAGINLLLLGMVYTLYTTLRDYNEIQKEVRKKELYNATNKIYFQNEVFKRE